MLETNSKCFGYDVGQITPICGPDADVECQFATSGTDPPRELAEGETRTVPEMGSGTYLKSRSRSAAQRGLKPHLTTAVHYIF